MNTDTPTIWEAPCLACGRPVMTDEHIGGWPYFFSPCECGGQASDDWRVSDEPHPALFDTADYGNPFGRGGDE
jgi:hypothetical protein